MAERLPAEQLPINTWILYRVSEFAQQKRGEVPQDDSILMEVQGERQLLVFRKSGPTATSDHIKEEHRGVHLIWRAFDTRTRVEVEPVGRYITYLHCGMGSGPLSETTSLTRRVVIPMKGGRYNEEFGEHKLREALQRAWDYAQAIRG
ncbi:hypothetical protein HY386_01270 [Candidatus Daviesbacteria bacterium]|nr:hypothetical protein [Candidatus Daviesbacteria bacterium]